MSGTKNVQRLAREIAEKNREIELLKSRLRKAEAVGHRDAAGSRTNLRKSSTGITAVPAPTSQVPMGRSLTGHPPNKRQRTWSQQSDPSHSMMRSSSAASETHMSFLPQGAQIQPAMIDRFYLSTDEPANHHVLASSMQMQPRRSLARLEENIIPDVGMAVGDFLASRALQDNFNGMSVAPMADSQYLAPTGMSYGVVPSQQGSCPSLISATTFSEGQISMTRQSSAHTSILDSADMGRLMSNASQFDGFSGSDFMNYRQGSLQHSPLDKSGDQLLAFTGGSLDMSTVNNQPDTARPADIYISPQAPAMERNSSSSSSSASSLERRAKETHRKHIENAKRNNNIKPKPAEAPKEEPKPADSAPKKDGKLAMTKNAYRRPPHPRQKCTKCDDQPEGFRGEHELRRHDNAKHAERIKKFVCCDPAVEGRATTLVAVNPLDKCKACVGQKQYGAYYNAAAHLRRSHFTHKAPRGKKGDKAEKGSKESKGSWGDASDIELLKAWYKEVIVDQQGQIIHDGDSDGDIDLPSEDELNYSMGPFGIPYPVADPVMLPSPAQTLSPGLSLGFGPYSPTMSGPISYDSQGMATLYTNGMSPAETVGPEDFSQASQMPLDGSFPYSY